MGNFNQKSKEAYNKKADGYDHSVEGHFTAPFKTLLGECVTISAGDHILDVACGSGLLLSQLAQKQPIYGFGVDISEKMIQNASVMYPNFTFQVADCEHIPFDDHSMDIMTVSAAYHHFPDVDAFARESARLLKSSGDIYIAEVYLPAIIRVLVNPFLPLSSEGDVKFYSTKQIERIFTSHHFDLVNVVKQKHIQLLHMKKH